MGDFNFAIVNFPFLDGDVPRPMMYIFRKLFILREYVLVLINSKTETNV